MRRRNYNSIILIMLAGFGTGLLCFLIGGCSDNPEAKAAKESRRQTTEAVQTAVRDKDYSGAQQKVMASLSQTNPQGLTKDAALLASGNLALAKGQQMQADLGLKTLPLRGSTDELEKQLRKSEQLLVEKERIEAILTSGQQEINELQSLLDGDTQTQTPGLTERLQQEALQLDELVVQKTALLEEKEQIQAVLDQYQADADALRRQAELAQGDQQLRLEKQAFDILLERKEHYVKLQEIENNIAVLDGKIDLEQVRVNGLTQSIQEIQARIEEIENSETRQALRRQIRQIEEGLSVNKQRMSGIAREIQTGLEAYRTSADQLCAVYEEAIGEFAKVRSGSTELSATIRTAYSYQYAALVCSAYIGTRNDFSERLQGLVETADPSFASMLQEELSIQRPTNTPYEQKAFTYFDQANEAYEKALAMSGSLGTEARCSLLKSQVLVLHSKMQLADLLAQYDLANAAETSMQALIQQGTELGVCFTQSEVMRVIENEGLDYLPSLPLNMEVFIDGKKEELLAWKGLPLQEQETAIDENLKKIDKLVAQYGQDVAEQLEPLKQEMLAAKERGFEEPAPDTSIGEPNSLF